MNARGLVLVGTLAKVGKVVNDKTGEVLDGLFEVTVNASMQSGGSPVLRSAQFQEVDQDTGLPTPPAVLFLGPDAPSTGDLLGLKVRAWSRQNSTYCNFNVLSVELLDEV